MVKPYWVQIGMLGIKTRAVAKIWLLASIVGSILFALLVVLVFKKVLDAPIMISILFGSSGAAVLFLSSLWYWLCIRWMDKHEGWQKKSNLESQLAQDSKSI